MSKDLATPKSNLIPKIERYNILNNMKIETKAQPLAVQDLINLSNDAVIVDNDILRDIVRVSPIRQNYIQ
jgi:hypothetical protein